MRLFSHAMAVAVASLAMGLAGCSRDVSWMDSQDRAEPLVQKARDKAGQGDTDAAIRLYTAALDANPKLAVAHLDLALLMHDTTKDYVRAIYHYERYLELRPTTEKRQMIEERMRLARQLLVASIVRPERYTDEKAALEKENQDLKDKVSALESDLARLQEESARQKPEPFRAAEPVAAAKEPVAHQEPPVEAAPKTVARVETPVSTNTPAAKLEGKAAAKARETAAIGSAASATAAPAAKKIRTYRVKRGDTLTSIAREVYQDSSKWRKIRDANRKTLGEASNVKVGQVLVIP